MPGVACYKIYIYSFPNRAEKRIAYALEKHMEIWRAHARECRFIKTMVCGVASEGEGDSPLNPNWINMNYVIAVAPGPDAIL